MQIYTPATMRYLSVPDDGALEDPVHAEDGGLRGVDDRGPEQGTEHSTVTELKKRYK